MGRNIETGNRARKQPVAGVSSAAKGKTRKANDEELIATAEFPSRWENRNLALSLLLALATVAVYLPVVQNSFVNYDDDRYILGLPQIQQPFSWSLIRWAFTTSTQANWHPLTWISHALDYQLFQSNPVAVHLENVCLHAVNSVILFWILLKATGKTWRSLAVAALFALHPLNVESVAWAAERKNVLSMLFFLLTLLAYQSYAGRRTIGRYLAVFAAFTLGLLAKPQIVTLPFVLLLWDVWPLRRQPLAMPNFAVKSLFGRLILEKMPLFVLSAASCLITLHAQAEGGAVGSLIAFPFSARIENALIEYVQYILHLFWPSKLSVLYPYPAYIAAWQIIGALAILIGVSATVIIARKQPYLLVGWFWFLGTLVPMIGLVQVGLAARADRYMYLPAIGLFLMVVWGVADWAEERSIPKSWIAASTIVLLTLLAIVTVKQISYWRNGETLWKRALEASGPNAIAEANLGTALLSLGRGEEAIDHFHRAIAIDPGDFLAQLSLGINEGQRGNPQGAIEHLKIALQRPSDSDMVELAYSNLGNAYRNLHDYKQAKENFSVALGMNPTDAGAAIGMGLIAQHDKNLPEAIHWYSQATLGRPNAVASLLMAKAMEKNGQAAAAQEAYQQAERVSKNMTATQHVVDQMLSHLD
jgi:protein O-mannosyl-transferase